MKKQHNKLRNTSLLFEILCRKLTAESLNASVDLPSLKIIKRHFKAGTELYNELKLYHDVIANPTEQVIETAKRIYSKFNKKKLLEEKYNLIKSIRSKYDLKEFMASFVSDYKKHASLAIIMEETAQPSVIVESMNYLMDSNKLSTVEEEIELDKQSAPLAFKYIVSKFNEKYKSLNEKQQRLLSKYINEDHNSEQFKNFVVREVKHIDKEITKISQKTINDVVRIKLNEISNLTHTILISKVIKDDHLSAMLQLYELIDELKK